MSLIRLRRLGLHECCHKVFHLQRHISVHGSAFDRHLHAAVHLLLIQEHLTSCIISDGAHGNSHIMGISRPSSMIQPWPTGDGRFGWLISSWAYTIAWKFTRRTAGKKVPLVGGNFWPKVCLVKNIHHRNAASVLSLVPQWYPWQIKASSSLTMLSGTVSVDPGDASAQSVSSSADANAFQ